MLVPREVRNVPQCTGECCEDFTLVENGEPLSWAKWDGGSGFPPDDLASLAIKGQRDGRFECSRFDSETKLCKDYENRPQACRDFPYQALQEGKVSNECRHCGYCSSEREP